MTDANLAKPRSFETKSNQNPGEYAPAPVPEFHQQTREPGYANSPGESGDDGGQEWPESTAAAGKFTEQSDDSGAEKKAAPAKSGGSTKAASTTTK